MSRRLFTILVAAGFVAGALPAEAQQRRGVDRESAEVDRLNQQSLDRARAGQQQQHMMGSPGMSGQGMGGPGMGATGGTMGMPPSGGAGMPSGGVVGSMPGGGMAPGTMQTPPGSPMR
ncbi:hypothetical protein [Falsiroseomonas oryziterrae]|uniref:hypothetical protein n=1 Tax=Falsiroseomonas oryziterrae TaxID=2911368 RepID=UPI001F3A4A3D|nr:hypothetical protein [Roseomonas sp. NPKOSM-4]